MMNDIPCGNDICLMGKFRWANTVRFDLKYRC